MPDMPAVLVRVMAIRYEAPDIRSYVLRRTDGVAFPGVDPGAHIDLRLPGGIARSFSLSNGASDPGDYRITIARDEGGRGGSIFMHDQVRAGDVLTMSAPPQQFCAGARCGIFSFHCRRDRNHAFRADADVTGEAGS